MPDGTLELGARLRGVVPGPALRVAGHLAELAWLGAPDDSAIAETRHRVFSARADAATSTMARGIFGWAAREAQGDPDGQAGD
jgi:hypothetical protein